MAISETVVAVVDKQDKSAPQRLRNSARSLRGYARQGLGQPAIDFAAALERISSNPADGAAFDKLEAVGAALDQQTRKICRVT